MFIPIEPYPQQKQNTNMDFSSANRLISKIDDLRREFIDVEMAIKGISQALKPINDVSLAINSIKDNINKLCQQNVSNDELNKMLAYIKPWLLKKKFKITVVFSNSELSLTPDGEEKLIEGIKRFIGTAKTLPIGMQVNSILIKSINRLLYDSETDVITIELNAY